MLLARPLPSAGVKRLRAECDLRTGGIEASAERLIELARNVDAIVADASVPVDAAMLEAAGGRLRIVANFGVGYDNVDLDACRRRGVVVTNTPDVVTNATAELALALTMAAARRVGEAERVLRAGRWASTDPNELLGTELTGATFGIVGMGRIGRRYAELVRPLAGAILFTSRSPKVETERDLGAVQVGLGELLRRADVVSLHTPAEPGTAGLIGREELRAMKPDAILVNTARGSLLDSDALAASLRAGDIGAAGLDVYEAEPEVPASLLEAPRCVLLPHLGSATVTARENMARLVADNVLAALSGTDPPTRVA